MMSSSSPQPVKPFNPEIRGPEDVKALPEERLPELAQAIRDNLIESLSRTGGKIPEAAKLLGLGRATLYRKVEEYGIER